MVCLVIMVLTSLNPLGNLLMTAMVALLTYIHSCLCSGGNPSTFGDVGYPIGFGQNTRQRADILEEFEPLAGRLCIHLTLINALSAPEDSQVSTICKYIAAHCLDARDYSYLKVRHL